MGENHMDFYRQLRNKINSWLQGNEGKNHKWAEYLMLVPDMFHLLCKLVMDPDVSPAEKAKLGAVIVYFVSPIDFIPEGFTGPLGFLDDLALTAYALNSIINHTDPQIIKKHWAGQDDILTVIKNIVATADQMVGSGVWNKLKALWKN
ncbi:MAG TPA: DUF1232 domain-containing protein [Syntrophomonadaceae bacterium]|jgi:uncharacterized membrane protein YkvA (DUF1232 family)|nr:DUF1232 domain-containing protein [Syntrophomonadaceae bacterium]HQE24278.1 DUF1232 domain-containing protein [Syntrophomonadaceae bacterium]